MILLSISLLIIAGISKAVKDRIMTGWSGSRFEQWGLNRNWWDNQISWRNKWKIENGKVTRTERFPLSSTVLVFLTDAWHLFDLAFMLSFAAGVWLVPINPVWSIVITLATFQTVYSTLRIGK
jgi:phosphotransferase system  glucose/maltose/N-acetylglucosamine-specific IIC component